MSAPSRSYSVSNRSGKSSTARDVPAQSFTTMSRNKDVSYFIPCAATASMFLYAQGRSVVCCRHDKLNIERKFSLHADEIQLLAVDNVSERGGGRIAVSYDAGQTAIVWDLMTGGEMSRSRLRNLTLLTEYGTGNTQGSIILYEPTTCEHISSRTIDQIAVTALAPSSDCRTFAIGYSNGSLLVATLQPRFTILHNLTTSKGPSPIVTLAWHASSSRSKSDMLAAQTQDGDLRVWSVTKSYNADDPAKVVRVLRRNENYQTGPNWMGWSKNGRIIQFSDSETHSWDVRTKHVTRDSIPTLEHVRGIAVYGPGASLFTLGPNNTVQQFDLNSPAIMVANVQHPAGFLPPSPPTEEMMRATSHAAKEMHTSGSESGSIRRGGAFASDEDEDEDDDHVGPLGPFTEQPGPSSGNDVFDSASSVSNRSGMSMSSRSSAASRTRARQVGSMRSRAMTENTYMSAGTSLKSSTVGKREAADDYSLGYSLASTSGPSLASSKSRHRPSRLRNEVPRSPDNSVRGQDLFRYTRSRLSDISYKHHMGSNNSLRLTNDDLRRQMLSTIFGWHREMDDLVRDEMSRHPVGSANRILLAKWLGDVDVELMDTSSQNMTSSDWMLLALSGIGGRASQHKLGRAFVQRLLKNDDVDIAVTIMLAMGDHNDAIEIYVSHKRYMEALILTCVTFPSVWERQTAIIRKWGEWAVQHGEQQLAIRCFACTGQESTEPWTSPSATQLTFQGITASMPEVLSPPLSPPGVQHGPQRSVAKSSALKLITTFVDPARRAEALLPPDDGQTPLAGGFTPIAESAISPFGGNEVATAFIRPSNNSRFNTPTSARPAGSNFGRGRLPSIGEISSDVHRDGGVGAADKGTPAMQQQHQRLMHTRAASVTQDNVAVGNTLQRAATASPMMMRDRIQRVVQDGTSSERAPSPDHAAISKMQQAQAIQRTVSRDRNTRGLHLQLQPMDKPDKPGPHQHQQQQQQQQEEASPEQASSKYQWPSRHRGPGSVAGSVASASSASRSLATEGRQQQHQQRDDHVHSLDASQYYSHRTARSRAGSKDRSQESSMASRHKSRERRGPSRDVSEERGRQSAQAWNQAKRSPTSPIPMSPQDLAILSTHKFSEAAPEPLAIRKANSVKVGKGSGKGSGRASSSRGRSKGRAQSATRAPSPRDMQGSEDEEEYRRTVEAHEEFRVRHGRSSSRGVKGGRRDGIENDQVVQVVTPMAQAQSRAASAMSHAGDLRQMKDERQMKKEQAARELEERRRSLAQRQPIATIPHPSEISPAKLPVAMEAEEEMGVEGVPPRSMTAPPKNVHGRNGRGNTVPAIGLPATPKAMRLNMRPDVKMEGASEMESEEGTGAEEAPSLLTLLPSTVYQPPPRLGIARSMSAPIPEEGSDGRHGRRKGSTGEVRGLGNILEQRRDEDERARPSQPAAAPPPPPPLLKELQHLAFPPPPPPVPLPHMQRPAGGGGGALGSGMIEIVMDEEEEEEVATAQTSVSSAGPRSHSRHRSRGEGSISGRSCRERMPSVTRSRQNSVKGGQLYEADVRLGEYHGRKKSTGFQGEMF